MISIVNVDDYKYLNNLYKDVDPIVLESVMSDFSTISTGILLYKFPNSGSNTNRMSCIINLVTDSISYYKTNLEISQQFKLTQKHKKSLLDNISNTSHGYFFESRIEQSDDLMFLLLMRKDAKLITAYFSTSYPLFTDTATTYPLDEIESAFSIIYKYFYTSNLKSTRH